MHGVHTSYVDGLGRHAHASPEALTAILRALGSPLESAADAPSALRAEREARWSRPIEPVILCAESEPLSFKMRLRADEADVLASFHLEPIDSLPGEPRDAGDPRHVAAATGAQPRRLEVRTSTLRRVNGCSVEGVDCLAVEVGLPWKLEPGYHRLVVEVGRRMAEATVIVAPPSAPPWPREKRAWGVFLPLYSAWRTDGPEIGDYSMLGGLAAWAGAMGASFYGTLPLTSAFLGEPYDPSPYAPVSRLFLNELYVDPWAIPEIDLCAEARAAAGRSVELDVGDEPPWARPVDYRRASAFKREVLSRLAVDLAGRSTSRAAAFREFVRSEPELQGYARFRAATEHLGLPWRQWPAALRDGAIGEEAAPAGAVLYHEYAQWVASGQMAEASRRALGAGACLYLDSPLGVHPEGYDAWRWRHLFAEGAGTGAPPDALFTGGQDWGFRPPHPERAREDGYRYFAMGLRKAMAHAGLLRIDHVMSLRRLFWVPKGASPTEGVYVSYPQAELFAVLCLEARRSGCAVVGEDLGTVPSEIREEMASRSLLGMHVMQIEVERSGGSLAPPPEPVMASLNTHDMPTFTAFLRGLDIEERHALGLLDESAAQRERARRSEAVQSLRRSLRERGLLAEGEDDEAALLKACLHHLAGGPSSLVQISLEDLWLVSRPQTVPGTSTERPNWTRRSRLAVEGITTSREAREILEGVARERRVGGGTGA